MFDRLPPVQALRVFEAAIRGDGVALARSPLVADDIAAGRQVAPFPHLRLKAERGTTSSTGPARATTRGPRP